jgi:hypothetical protein
VNETPASSSPSSTHDHTPPMRGLLEVPGMVQMVLTVYDPERGWLTTKRGIIHGGRHGELPLIEKSVDEVVDILSVELRTGIRAMQSRWAKG